MYVLNKEKRVMYLGDGLREKDAEGNMSLRLPVHTRIDPGQCIALEDIPANRQVRFKQGVRNQIKAGFKLEILSERPAKNLGSQDLEALRTQKALDEFDKLGSTEETPAKRGPGRPRKTPLGG